MSVCSGIRADGRRCQAQAMRNSEWCINHHPDRGEARRRRASKGGKRGGRGRPIAELGALRDENADIRPGYLRASCCRTWQPSPCSPSTRTYGPWALR